MAHSHPFPYINMQHVLSKFGGNPKRFSNLWLKAPCCGRGNRNFHWTSHAIFPRITPNAALFAQAAQYSCNAFPVCCRLQRSPRNFGYRPSVRLPFSESARSTSLMNILRRTHARTTCVNEASLRGIRLRPGGGSDGNVHSVLCGLDTLGTLRGIMPRRRGVIALPTHPCVHGTAK